MGWDIRIGFEGGFVDAEDVFAVNNEWDNLGLHDETIQTERTELTQQPLGSLLAVWLCLSIVFISDRSSCTGTASNSAAPLFRCTFRAGWGPKLRSRPAAVHKVVNCHFAAGHENAVILNQNPSHSSTTHPANMPVPWTRLIRFAATDGRVLRGEPILPSPDFDIGNVTEETKLQAKVIEGSDIYDTTGATRVTDEVVTVKKLLGPLAPEDIPILRCVGLNYAKHSKSDVLIPTRP